MVGGWPGESEHVPCGECLSHAIEPLPAHSHSFALHAAGCAHCGHLGVLPPGSEHLARAADSTSKFNPTEPTFTSASAGALASTGAYADAEEGAPGSQSSAPGKSLQT
jgi:hypothetical protein